MVRWYACIDYLQFLQPFTVSLVDGYNLPMAVTNSVGCSVADCPVDLGPSCKLNSLFCGTVLMMA